jgi:queuine tRNA-ribosyltransferase
VTAVRFETLAVDPASRARRGRLHTRRGPVETPAFMPVGTRATVTGLTVGDVRAAGASMILANTYHLLLRPGPEVMRRVGGIHRFMRWDGPVLTDSGGFQIFSLAEDRTVDEAGARFRSYVDQRIHVLSPERSIEVQTAIGSDVMMVLDVCLPSTAPAPAIREAMERTHRWALRSLAARTEAGQALFAIVQGGLDPALRAASAGFLAGHPFDGFAIGGLAVGDTREERGGVVARAAELLPPGRPRYLMGVGTPADLLEAIGHGVDLFDCVLPTTLAWQGTAFTSSGRVRLTRGEHLASDAALDAACPCPTCRDHPRGYLHHLVKCREPLGPRLLAVHNLHHYLGLMAAARAAIEDGRYAAFARETLAALDRHEHDRSGRPPGRRRAIDLPASPPSPRSSRAVPGAAAAGGGDGGPAGAGGDGGRAPRFEIVLTSQGAPAVRDHQVGEVMHPVVGAAVESERLYVAQSRLRERLAEPGPPLVLLDVGLGAGANALAALRAGLAAAGRGLEIVSLDRETDALALAASDDGAARLGLAPGEVEACRAILGAGRFERGRVRWRLVRGDLHETLPGLAVLADVLFWDPYSPRADPAPWSLQAFSAARARCAPGATLFTYSTATATRTSLLLAGFAVGRGDPSGPKEETTAAATDAALLARPLDARWLERVARSSAPFPDDAPPDALERLRALPQLAARVAAPA